MIWWMRMRFVECMLMVNELFSSWLHTNVTPLAFSLNYVGPLSSAIWHRTCYDEFICRYAVEWNLQIITKISTCIRPCPLIRKLVQIVRFQITIQLIKTVLSCDIFKIRTVHQKVFFFFLTDITSNAERTFSQLVHFHSLTKIKIENRFTKPVVLNFKLGGYVASQNILLLANKF